MRRLFCIAAFFLASFHTLTLKAQDLLTAKNLNSIKVENLSESDIARIKLQLENNNLTIEQVEPMLTAKGLSAEEFIKLKNRLSLAQAGSATSKSQQTGDKARVQESYENRGEKDSLFSKIFGADLFDKPNLNFEPNLKLATPMNYILGPGDELNLNLFGMQEFNSTAAVSADGRIDILHVGQIAVAGITIEAATQKIRSAFSKIYSSLRSGQSQLSVSLSRIRTIKVTIIGARQPGNYSLSSLSTAFNALYVAGGPSKNGSFRNIELIRDNKVIRQIDIYKFIINGDQSDNIGLKDNDVIKIPVYNNRITIEGEVKRPGIFEIRSNETFADALSFSSGFSDIAYTASVNVIQKTNKEYKVKDLTQQEFSSYQPLPGDVFKVSKILDRYSNRVKIQGAVFRPDIYSFTEGMRIKDLIAKADGLKEDAYSKRAVILRHNPNLTTEIVDVNVDQAMAGGADQNVLLQKEDEVTIFSIAEFKEEYTLTINGEIKKPGVYSYHQNLTLNDLLVQAGGLLNSASNKVEVARMIKSANIDSSKIKLFDIIIDPSSNEQAKNFQLEPFDIVNVRKLPVYNKPQEVIVTGAVVYSGNFAISKNEKVLDVINRAGGLSPEADVKGVKIKRPIQQKQIEALEDVNINLGKADSNQTNSLVKKLKEDIRYAVIPIDWEKIVNNPNDYSNITLLPGDLIDVAMRNENVKVTGNVLLTSEIPYVAGKGFNYYVGAVGGIDSKGWKKKAYIIYPNGRAAVTGHFLFLKFYPKVIPGSQIVIPEKPPTNKLSVGEIGSIASVLAGMTGLIIAIFK